jgi:sporulation protein YlmC with PRC-barrel domain
MKRSLGELSGYTIQTTDGKKGKVKDFLFDEKQWVIRFLEADFGNLFSEERVLIPKVFLKQPSWDNKSFPVELLESEIERCPKISDHLPVSRKYEEELYKHYRLDPYWSGAYMGAAGDYYPPRPVKVPSRSVSEDELDTILRSFKEVEGYHIHALNGTIGHVEDILIDDVDWQILYAVIDTKNWLPWSKQVLIAIDWMENISYEKREVMINLLTDTIKSAPEYNPLHLINDEFEKGLIDFYSSSLTK